MNKMLYKQKYFMVDDSNNHALLKDAGETIIQLR